MLNKDSGSLLHFFVSLVAFAIEELKILERIYLLDSLTWFGHKHAEDHLHELLRNQSVSVQLPCVGVESKEIGVSWFHFQKVVVAVELVLRWLEWRGSEGHHKEQNS